MMAMIVYAALAILMANLVFGVFLWFKVRKLYCYPGVLGFPVIGNLYNAYKTLLMITVDRGVKYGVAVAEEHGKDGIFFHWLCGSNVAAVITSPHLVKKLSFHPNLADKSYAIYNAFKICMDGPFSDICSDDEWKQKRKDYNINLKKSRVDSDYFNTFIKRSDKMVEKMLASSSSHVDAHAICSSVVYDISLKTMFGIDSDLVYHPDLVRVYDRIKVILATVVSDIPMIHVIQPILHRIIDVSIGKLVELRKLGLAEIDNKLKSNEGPLQDLTLFMYMALKHKKDNGSERILFNKIHELFLTSGHTVASVLSNMTYFLAVLPDIQERAWQEQYEIFGNDVRDPTIADLNQMKYLSRFMKESLRFVGPSVVVKSATADITIDGITIPRGTQVVFLLRYIKFDPKYFKNPNIFDPDRFLDESDVLKCGQSSFGAGIRNCPGEYFATILLKIVLSKMLRSLKLKTVDKNFRFEDMKYKSYILGDVENPPKLQVEKRT
ncbi:unnamed protein product [Nezara viridula]|uniref:Cytochrome P450 n=1 Tax=Nezara viridula TaxID=85310 RepID=A0A9P0HQS8_NEZVI|nr:unnamed protein product [Nezara viridula]